jgi:oligosaccharide repeat unit polymerase
MLLAVALAAHLAAAVNAIFGEGLAGATLFVTGQFALSLALLRLYNGVWVLQDIRMPIVLFLFLYGATLPAISILKGEELAGLTGAAFLFGTAFAGFNLVQWWHKQPWRNVTEEAFEGTRASFASTILFLGSFVGLVAYAWSMGTREFLTLDRSQMRWLYTQAWIVANMLINGFVMYLFAGWRQLSPAAKRITVVTIIMFVVLQLGLGNRHAFLPMFVFLAGVVASRRRQVIGVRTILIAVFAFLLLMAVGVVRQVRRAPWLAYSSQTLIGIAQHNEFTMPIQTVMYYLTTDKPLKYGASYLAAPEAFIPRSLWPEKPVSLSLEFSRDQFGDIIATGYAYTPVTEAYVNFSYVGPFIILALVSLATVALVKHARDKPMLYFLCFALVIDFNRGESLSVLYPIAVTLFSFWLMSLISRIDWVPSRSRRGSALELQGDGVTAV